MRTTPSSFVLFRIPAFTLADLRRSLEEHAFAEPPSPRKEAWGFEPYPGSADTLDCVGEYLRFGLRCDKRSVPPKLVKARTAERIAAWKSEHPDRAKVPASVKAEIKETVMLDLLAQTLPVPTVYPVILHATEGWAIVGATATSVVEQARQWLSRVFGPGVGQVGQGELQREGEGIVPESRSDDDDDHDGLLGWLWYNAAHGIPITVGDDAVKLTLEGGASVGGLKTKDAESLLPRCLLSVDGEQMIPATIRSLTVGLEVVGTPGLCTVTLDGDAFKGVVLPAQLTEAQVNDGMTEDECFVSDMYELSVMLRLLRGLAQAFRRLSAEEKGHAAYLRAWERWAVGIEAVGEGDFDRVTAAQIQEVIEIVQDPDSERGLALHETLRAAGFDGLQGRLFDGPDPLAQRMMRRLGASAAREYTDVARRIAALRVEIAALKEGGNPPDEVEEWASAVEEIGQTAPSEYASAKVGARLSGIERAVGAWEQA